MLILHMRVNKVHKCSVHTLGRVHTCVIEVILTVTPNF